LFHHQPTPAPYPFSALQQEIPMQVKDFKERRKNTLRGFFTLETSFGLEIKDCSLHEKNGKAWFGFPGVPFTDKEGNTAWRNVIVIPDRAVLDKVTREVCKQLSRHLDDAPVSEVFK
jgi:hypothetical protein